MAAAPPNWQAIADNTATRIAAQNGIDPNVMRAIFHAQINQESRFNVAPSGRGADGSVLPNGSGAVGIAQIVPKWHPGVNAADPKAALAYAAQMDANNYKKYGNWNDTLSVYNSGRPWSVGQGFGQTNNYVKSILAAAHAPGASKATKAAAAQVIAQGTSSPQGASGDPTGARNALLSMLQGNLSSYASTGQTNSNPMQLQQALTDFQTANAPSTLPKAPGKVLAGIKPYKAVTPDLSVPRSITTIPGTTYQANTQIIPQIESITKGFGVRVNSGYRDPQHNKDVGGAPNSDHLSGNAIDFVGSQAQMKRLYEWAQGKFPYVEPWDQAKGNHVHISFIR